MFQIFGRVIQLYVYINIGFSYLLFNYRLSKNIEYSPCVILHVSLWPNMPVFAKTVKHCWNQPAVGCFSEGGGTIITESVRRGSSGPQNTAAAPRTAAATPQHRHSWCTGNKPPRHGSLTQSPWGHLMAPFSKKLNHQHSCHQLEWGHSGRNFKHGLKGERCPLVPCTASAGDTGLVVPGAAEDLKGGSLKLDGGMLRNSPPTLYWAIPLFSFPRLCRLLLGLQDHNHKIIGLKWRCY